MTDICIDNNVDVKLSNNIDVCSTGSNINVCTSDISDLTIESNKKEFNIVGDSLYIPRLAEDAPSWMRSLISTTVNAATDVLNGDLSSAVSNLNTAITELEIAKNTYTQSIISSNDIDQRINSAITTLNAQLSSSDATILDVAQTATTPDEAKAISSNVLSASILDTDTDTALGAIINTLNTAIATGDQANSSSITSLEASIEGDLTANSTAVESLQAYVGIDEAGASTNTGLSAYLEDPNTGTIGGVDSELASTIRTTSEGVESKFAYNSILKVNNNYYTAGFGLNALVTGGAGTQDDPYDSEFWVNAEKFKFTNSAVSGQAAPFVIDASGSTPQVTFDGVVDFTNTNIKNGSPGTTKINSGSIETNAITASKILADSATARKILSNEVVISTSAVSESKVRNDTNSLIIDFKEGSIFIS